MNKREYDIIVIGVGPAGFCCGVAAARMGKEVLMIEASDSILGNITGGPLEAIMTFHDESRQVIKGIPDEFVRRCVEIGGSLGHVNDTIGYAKTITPFSPEICKYVGYTMLKEENMKVLTQACLLDCMVDKRKIESVRISSKNETRVYKAKVFVDCTGDGDLAVLAGCGYAMGDVDGNIQPMTSLMQLGGVDNICLANWVLKHPEEFKFFSQDALLEIAEGIRSFANQAMHLWGFYSLLKDGFEKGALSLNRREMHLITGPHPNQVIINYSRYSGNPLNMDDRSDAQAETVIQGYRLWKWLKENNGAFKDSWIEKIGKIGIRESRRINGYYQMTKEGLETGRVMEHPIAIGSFPIDIHSPRGNSMEYQRLNKGCQIPWESLVTKDIDNLLCAGRCICCTHEAQGSIRITATAMATGAGAGIGAALVCNENVACIGLDYELLRQALELNNMIIK